MEHIEDLKDFAESILAGVAKLNHNGSIPLCDQEVLLRVLSHADERVWTLVDWLDGDRSS